jgi:enamine deaminase RidA (YjgF/YER057c/UK114 family)
LYWTPAIASGISARHGRKGDKRQAIYNILLEILRPVTLERNMSRSSLRLSAGACVIFLAGFVLGGIVLKANSTLPESGAAQPAPAQVSAEEKVKQLKLELPPVKKPSNTLVSAARVGDMLYVSGTGPSGPGGKAWVGQLGKTMTVEEGNKAARQVGLQILSVVKAELGSLDKVVRVVKTLGMVNATADFKDHPKVINGFSDLMVEVFGDWAGKGARSAVGMSSLPGGIPVEIEVIFQIKP